MSGLPRDGGPMDGVPDDTHRHLKLLAAARTYGEALRHATALLRERASRPTSASLAMATPDLDAQVLLAHVTATGRALLLAYPERPLAPEQAEDYAALIERRLRGEPVAYLTGHREFLGLDLRSDARALIPRPETELLVESALAALDERLRQTPPAHPEMPSRLVAADIGTGSGAIALALAAREPRLAHVYATDVSAAALALARRNVASLNLAGRITVLLGDLLDPLPEPVDVLLANLPYIARTDAETLPREVRAFEPELALFGAEDGLALLRRFFATAPFHTTPGALVGVEFGYNQRDAVEALARDAFPSATVRVGRDYAGWERFLLVLLDGETAGG